MAALFEENDRETQAHADHREDGAGESGAEYGEIVPTIQESPPHREHISGAVET